MTYHFLTPLFFLDTPPLLFGRNLSFKLWGGGFKKYYFMAGKIAENWSREYTSKNLKIAIFWLKKFEFPISRRLFDHFDSKVTIFDQKIAFLAIFSV